MLNDLRNIISKAATELTGSIDRFYYWKVPQNTSFPYVSYYIITETYQGQDSQNLLGDVKVQFNIFSNYADYGSQCNTILQEVLNYFDNDFLSYANASGSASVISCLRDFTRASSYSSQDDVWQATVQYNIKALN